MFHEVENPDFAYESDASGSNDMGITVMIHAR
ncbi:hypothetical protein C8D97_102247 [Pleionea mediterranea]|jgi:hypothetical protein|uniref:Uncharacterized protein n=1 Tax=Pleionea mediterranea TaxID=523701 RepID=A0A316GGK2_9GAMM|nr:hypothetical protein C8D97_102247 [Pleionea mediterranea]